MKSKLIKAKAQLLGSLVGVCLDQLLVVQEFAYHIAARLEQRLVACRRGHRLQLGLGHVANIAGRRLGRRQGATQQMRRYATFLERLRRGIHNGTHLLLGRALLRFGCRWRWRRRRRGLCHNAACAAHRTYIVLITQHEERNGCLQLQGAIGVCIGQLFGFELLLHQVALHLAVCLVQLLTHKAVRACFIEAREIYLPQSAAAAVSGLPTNWR